SIPAAAVLAQGVAAGAAAGLVDGGVAASAERDRLLVPAGDGEAVGARDAQALEGADDGRAIGGALVGAPAGVVIEAIDLGGVAQQAVRVAGVDEVAVRGRQVVGGRD